MSKDTRFKHECDPENARKFWEWIQNRGGVANWKSINLSNPGASWSTPANDPEGAPTTKPTWQASNQPTICTDPDEIGVYESELFKAFPVALRRAGLSLKLTDGSQRKLDKALDQCREKHGDSFYRKGVLDIEGASMGVYYTKSVISLREWIEKNGAQDAQG